MIEVGQFVICGDWDSTPTPAGKLRIVMPPLGHLEGGGWSAFTQAGLNALPQEVKRGKSFAEIGAGSGILCVAARLLGAGHIVATELDKEALAYLPTIFAANAMSNYEIIDGTFPPSRVDLAICAISTEFGQVHAHNVNANRVLNINDVRHGAEVIVIK